MVDEIHLEGLDGTNPLGFLAALGVQVIFASESEQPRLWWTKGVAPHAVVDKNFTVDRITDQALRIFALWESSPALNPKHLDGSALSRADELKLSPEDIRTYLSQVNERNPSSYLISALVAEGSLDNSHVAKPSDLYFTAGQQKFLDMARKILRGTSRSDVLEGLEGPWTYSSKLPSLMWDVNDDRVYALTANSPTREKKLTNPGPEALAIFGLTLYQVFAGRNRTLTPGCSGDWKAGYYTWPLWSKPSYLNTVKSLLAHTSLNSPKETNHQYWFNSWGITTVFKSSIRRSSQGGYGTFGPPEVVWKNTQRQ